MRQRTRNYNKSSGVQVMVFADRVEVWNSGSLPPELTVEDLKKPHTPFPANPFLANDPEQGIPDHPAEGLFDGASLRPYGV